MKKIVRDYSSLVAVAGLVIAIDQVTKALVRTRLAFSESWSPWEWLAPYARLVHWQNTGAAFGMMQGFSIIFAVLAVIVSVAIFYYYPQVSPRDWALRLAMGLQLGGALGNLIDRILFNGQVTDFISVGNFAVFNIADSSITVGVVVLLLWLWWKEGQDKAKAAQANAEPPLGTETGAPPEGPAGE